MPFDFAMTTRLMDEAREENKTLSAKLEELDPTNKYPLSDPASELDAYERQLARLNVRTASIPDYGVMADTWDKWDDLSGLADGNERRSLKAEFMRRAYVGSGFGGRALGHSLITGKSGGARTRLDNSNMLAMESGRRFPGDATVSYTLYPPAVLDMLRYQQLQPSALEYLIARTRMIDSETFTALYLTSDSAAATAARLARTEEFAEPAIFQFTTGESSFRVTKYANSLRVSYEQMRRMRIDLISWGIGYIAQKADLDKELSAVNILINGDGNGSTAATNTNGSTLDSGGALTLKMYLKWRYLWTRPYTCNVIVATANSIVDTFLLNAGSANIAPAVITQSNRPEAVTFSPVRTLQNGVIVVDNATVASNTLCGIDATASLEMLMESGSQIVQTDQVILNQYNEIVFSENIGWDIAIRGQNRTLAYTA